MWSTDGANALARLERSELQVTLKLGSHEFAGDELVVMGVVNRTPDSFYDAGATYQLQDAINAVDSVVENGAQSSTQEV